MVSQNYSQTFLLFEDRSDWAAPLLRSLHNHRICAVDVEAILYAIKIAVQKECYSRASGALKARVSTFGQQKIN